MVKLTLFSANKIHASDKTANSLNKIGKFKMKCRGSVDIPVVDKSFSPFALNGAMRGSGRSRIPNLDMSRV